LLALADGAARAEELALFGGPDVGALVERTRLRRWVERALPEIVRDRAAGLAELERRERVAEDLKSELRKRLESSPSWGRESALEDYGRVDLEGALQAGGPERASQAIARAASARRFWRFVPDLVLPGWE